MYRRVRTGICPPPRSANSVLHRSIIVTPLATSFAVLGRKTHFGVFQVVSLQNFVVLSSSYFEEPGKWTLPKANIDKRVQPQIDPKLLPKVIDFADESVVKSSSVKVSSSSAAVGAAKTAFAARTVSANLRKTVRMVKLIPSGIEGKKIIYAKVNYNRV